MPLNSKTKQDFKLHKEHKKEFENEKKAYKIESEKINHNKNSLKLVEKQELNQYVGEISYQDGVALANGYDLEDQKLDDYFRTLEISRNFTKNEFIESESLDEDIKPNNTENREKPQKEFWYGPCLSLSSDDEYESLTQSSPTPYLEAARKAINLTEQTSKPTNIVKHLASVALATEKENARKL